MTFFPIRCSCNQLFCRDHIALELHSCPQAAAVHRSVEPPAVTKRQRCAAGGCTKPSLESAISFCAEVVNRTPAVCPRCKLSFCAFHRDPVSHSCSVNDEASATPSKNEAARKLLQKYFPSSSPDTTSKVEPAAQQLSTRKTSPQAKRVELMRMRHRAQPGDPKDKASAVPIEQRLHVKVLTNSGSGNPPEKIYWFRKTIGTGKALDLIASQLGMESSPATPLQITKIDPTGMDSADLRTDMLLSAQIEDGAHLLICRRE